MLERPTHQRRRLTSVFERFAQRVGSDQFARAGGAADRGSELGAGIGNFDFCPRDACAQTAALDLEPNAIVSGVCSRRGACLEHVLHALEIAEPRFQDQVMPGRQLQREVSAAHITEQLPALGRKTAFGCAGREPCRIFAGPEPAPDRQTLRQHD